MDYLPTLAAGGSMPQQKLLVYAETQPRNEALL